MAIHTEKSWKRHSNPWSVWTRILTYPLVYLPFWNRSWKQGAAVAAWFAANPVIFPAPEDDSSWATRSVLGEQLWTAERRRDIPMALNTASAVFFAGAILSAYRRRLWPMMVCAGPSLLLKMWFIDRMTFYYEEHKERQEPRRRLRPPRRHPLRDLSELRRKPLLGTWVNRGHSAGPLQCRARPQ